MKRRRLIYCRKPERRKKEREICREKRLGDRFEPLNVGHAGFHFTIFLFLFFFSEVFYLNLLLLSNLLECAHSLSAYKREQNKEKNSKKNV